MGHSPGGRGARRCSKHDAAEAHEGKPWEGFCELSLSPLETRTEGGAGRRDSKAGPAPEGGGPCLGNAEAHPGACPYWVPFHIGKDGLERTKAPNISDLMSDGRVNA